jgi:heme/copper-type cytochrome/quinol oxidase subunit 2
MRRRVRDVVVATAAVAVMVTAGCGDDATTSSTTTSASIATTSSVTSLAPASTTTTAGNATTTTTAATTIEVAYAGGKITGGGKRGTKLGEPVVIKVTSDVADEIHVHGYDKKADAGPGLVATITFVADKPGIFELELEKKHLRLLELEVK